MPTVEDLSLVNELIRLNVRAGHDNDGKLHFYDAETGEKVRFAGGLAPELSPSLVKRLNMKVGYKFNIKKKAVASIVRVQGDLVVVEPVVKKPVKYNRQGGTVGRKIRGFSRNSRRRLMKLCASTLVSPDAFSTLTFDDTVLELVNESTLNPEAQNAKMKDYGHNLSAALQFRFKGIGLIWRVENQPRKRGEFKGQMVPHMHQIIWLGGHDADQVREFIMRKWLEYTGTENPDAYAVTERAKSFQMLDGRREAVSYVSKYIAKIDDDYGFSCGRVWGKIGNVPVGEEKEFHLTEDETKQLRRIVKRWKSNEERFSRYINKTMFENVSCSLFVSGAAMISVIKYLMQAPEIPF